MTDYVSQVAFCRKPLVVAKADISELRMKVKRVTTSGTVKDVEVEERILKGRTASKESITVLRQGNNERHCLYQSPNKLTYNQVFSYKEKKGRVNEKVDRFERRYLLWGSPSDCYNRMFGGTATEGGKHLPCRNPGLHRSEWDNAKATGNFHGAYHPKYWGMDWAYQQWVKAEKQRRAEGSCIEEAIRRQIESEEFHVVEAAPRVFKIPRTRKRGGGGNGTAHDSAKSTATPVAKQTLQIPEIALGGSRSVMSKPSGDRPISGKRKASPLGRDRWILVPKEQSYVPSNADNDKVPSLHVTSSSGREYELVERPPKIRRLDPSADEESRRKQKKLEADFERWDLYVKRKEEQFANRGDLTDNTSDMMKRFRVEEKAAEDARAWWKKEQKIRDQTWTYDDAEYSNAALEARYHQLYKHFETKLSAQCEEGEAAEDENRLMKRKEVEMREIAKLIVLGIVVATKDGFKGGGDAVIADGLMAKLKEHKSVIYELIVNDKSISLESLVANRGVRTERILANTRSMPKTRMLPGGTSSI